MVGLTHCKTPLSKISGSWKALPEPDLSLVPRLVGWFAAHGRQFPWRETVDPYHILCAEVMLQRTRALQVAPVHAAFCQQYRTSADFLVQGPGAAADVFRSLGLTWRAKLFWDMHLALAEQYGGIVPRSAHELKDLPGVGDYAAAAVRVFAFGESLTVVDSNVLRVLGRYHGIVFSDSARRSRRVAEWARQLAPPDSEMCRRWNWALIDLGALVCIPAQPRHSQCPIHAGCRFAETAG
jgi:A/G-specific adenine glycosylase